MSLGNESGRHPWSSRVLVLYPILLPALAFLITVAAYLPVARWRIDSQHDGFMFKAALDVFEGQTLFKDSFMCYGALSIYLQAGFLWAMGKSLLAVKVGTVLCYGVIAAFLVASWRMLLPRSLVVLCFLILLAMPTFYIYNSVDKDVVGSVYIYSSVYSLTFQSMSLFFLLRTLKSPALLDPLLCGATAALTVWCRQTVGAFHSLSIVFFLSLMILRSPQRGRFLAALAAFLAGSAAIHAGFFLHLWWVGALRDWYYQNIVYPAHWLDDAKGGVIFGEVGLERQTTAVFGPAFGRVVASGVNVVPCLLLHNHVVPVAGPVFGRRWVSLLLLVGLLAIPQLRRPASTHAPGEKLRPLLWTLLPLVVYVELALLVLRDYYGRDVPIAVAWHLAVPVVVLAATTAALVRSALGTESLDRPEGTDTMALGCGLVCLASWLQYYPVNEPYHRFWAMAPGIGLFAFLLLRSAGGRVLPVALALALFAAPLWADRIGLAVEAGRRPTVKIGGDSVLAGMDVLETEAPAWTALLETVDRQVAARPDIPMISR